MSDYNELPEIEELVLPPSPTPTSVEPEITPILIPISTSVYEEVREELKEELVEDIISFTLLSVLEDLLTKNKSELEHINIKLTPELSSFILILCKEFPSFFYYVELSLSKILKDNTINTKDIPEIIYIIIKLYEIIKTHKKEIKNLEPDDIIKTLIKLLFIIYIQNNKIKNPELEKNIESIIDASLNLINLKAIKPNNSKKGCLSSFFNKN